MHLMLFCLHKITYNIFWFNILHKQIIILFIVNNYLCIKVNIMKPTKEGEIVKFHTPPAGENPNQLYVVLAIKIDGVRDRADIQSL